MDSAPEVAFVLNGESRAFIPREGETLLEALRHRFGITSTKDGCAPQAQCGCCLALVDGAPKMTCAMPVRKAAGREVVTLEGLDDDERAALADAFASAAALQCGFCTPGFALRAKTLLDRNPSPTRAEIARALDGHLCRCTGYVKIFAAVELLARRRRGEAAAPRDERAERDEAGGVGARATRFQARELTLGSRPFVADLRFPGMLFGAVALTPEVRGRVLAIDTSRAERLAGVVRVVTAADVPGERWGGLIVPDWPVLVAVGEEVRCTGDVLAAVAARDVQTARRAAALVDVTVEPAPPILDVDVALAAGAPAVNPRHAGHVPHPELPNLLSECAVRRGDAEAALAASAHVVHHTWQTQRVEHLFLEPESATAVPFGDGAPDGVLLHLYSPGQGVFDDRARVAAVLGVAEERVHVELVANGGAFGGKEDSSVQPHAALLAHLSGCPVQVTLTREQSIRFHPKRHPIAIDLQAGCDERGHLTAVVADLIGDTGAYASVGAKVLERAAGHVCGPYRVPAVAIRARAVTTNNPPCGAMRGFGANQAHFAMEGALDELAAAAGVDRLRVRELNALVEGDTFCTGQLLDKPVGILATLDAVRPAYEEAQRRGRAVGIACGVKNTGIGNGVAEWGKARLAVEGDGTITLYNGYTEMGQGLFTVLAQMAAEVTGLPCGSFRPRVDSTFALGCGQTTGSRATLFGGLAVASAARKLRAALDKGHSLDALAGRVFAADVVVDDTVALGAGEPGRPAKTHTAYSWATQLVLLDEAGRIERVVAAHDVGRAVNPALCEGQIEGAVHMGLGYALTEELPLEGGVPATTRLRDLGVLRASDMPEVDVHLVEVPEPEGPFGVRGVGEIGLVPTAAAVASALAEFDGIRRRTLPLRDSPAARALRAAPRPRAGEA